MTTSLEVCSEPEMVLFQLPAMQNEQAFVICVYCFKPIEQKAHGLFHLFKRRRKKSTSKDFDMKLYD